jgi:hypothetical protein
MISPYNFEVRHPRCVSNKSNYKVYAYIVGHSYVLGGMLFTICKAQLHVSAMYPILDVVISRHSSLSIYDS